MDFVSSSFLSSLPTPKLLPSSLFFSPLKILSARIEDEPKTSIPRALSQQPLPTLLRKVPTKIKQEKQQPLPTIIFKFFDDLINNFIDPPLRPSVDPKHVLSNNFAPVDELPPTKCQVIQGCIPPCLNGAYIRNGPNPQFLPRGPYHLFDGDGMLHCMHLSNANATFCSRYVKTYKYNIEKNAGSSILPNVFSGFNGLIASASRGALSAIRVLAGQYNPANGIGLANTSLAFFGNNLYALGESDIPYAIKVTENGDVVTLGRYDFDGKLIMNMTAHPKIDPDTNEAFAFRYGPMPPFLTYFHFDPNGGKQEDVPIFSMVQPSFMHDFAITKKYAIFSDIQIGMNLVRIIAGESPIAYNPGKIPRLGVIPRYAKDESQMRWLDVPGFNIIHAINAWDEIDNDGDVIVIVAPNILSVEHTLERMDLVHAMVEMVRIDLKTGTVTRCPILARNLDFGVINRNYMTKKNKYVYAAIGDPMPKISGVVKLDISMADQAHDSVVACRMFGHECYGGEPFFVPNENAESEDDGYVVTYVHDEINCESRFLVMDAKTPELDIVAAVKLPRRVPYGFHGLFVKESDLRNV